MTKYKADATLSQIDANIKSNPDVAKKINGSYKFVIAAAGGEETWIVDLKKNLVAKQVRFVDIVDAQLAYVRVRLRMVPQIAPLT